MHRFVTLLTLGATFTAVTAAAQAPTSGAAASWPPPLASPDLRYSMEDTIRAMQQLFMSRTRDAEGWVSGGATLVVGAVVDKTFQTRRSSEWRRRKANDDLVFGGAMLGYGLWKMARFGPQQYAAVVAAYEQGEPLPDYVRRRLKNRYFRY